MPTVLQRQGYRFHWYSYDVREPAHVHVERAGHEAKVWLRPLRLADSDGFTAPELQKIVEMCPPLATMWRGPTRGLMAYQPIIVAKKATVRDRVVYLWLADGSTHSFPTAFYPRLLAASDPELKKVTLRLGGKALRWDDLDEDIWIGHAVVGKYPASSASAFSGG